MTGNQTRRVLVTGVAAVVLVIGGAVAASGQMGALRDRTTTGSPADGRVAGDVTDNATDDVTEDETTEAETTEADDEATDAEDEANQDEADATTEDEGSDGEDPDGTEPKAPCVLTSPPNRAADGTDADRHPGWSTGKHLGWCVAAAHHDTTGQPAKPGNARGEKRVDKHARPAVKVPKQPHPGKGHAKHH